VTEEKDPKSEGHEQDFSALAKHSGPRPETEGPHRTTGNMRWSSFGRMLLRGCGIVVGVVVMLFFLIVGVCFLG